MSKGFTVIAYGMVDTEYNLAKEFKRCISKAIEKYPLDDDRAAEALGMPRRSFYRAKAYFGVNKKPEKVIKSKFGELSKTKKL